MALNLLSIILKIEAIGQVILPFLVGLANNGGVGGGGLIIPISMSLFGFTSI